MEKELYRLKNRTNIGYNLSVIWVPDSNSKLSGEVIGNTIYIYEENEEKAIETLKHEFIDYHITREIVARALNYLLFVILLKVFYFATLDLGNAKTSISS